MKLDRSPLVLVLAQIRFSTVLAMPKYIADLQEALRHKGFPKFMTLQTQQIQLAPDQIQMITSLRWAFVDKEATSAVIVAPDFVVLQTNKYDTFETFTAKLLEVLQAIKEVVAPALAERLGLRFVDLVRPAQTEALTDYLQPGLQGFAKGALAVRDLTYRFEAVGQTDAGTMVTRVLQTMDGSFLPPGLEAAGLQFAPEIRKTELKTMLDFDHFTNEARDFVPERLVADMWALHDHTDNAFRASVTPHALEQWGRRSK